MLVYILGVTFAVAVGLVEFATGAKLTLALFSLMPVVLVTWNLGGRAGVALATLSTAAVVLADLAATHDHGVVPYWDGGVQLLVLVFVVWILSTLRDAVDAQQVRLDLERRAANELRHLNAVKDTLLHAVSHDLKSPLAAILGAMQTLRREAQLVLTPEEHESLYSMIEQSGRKMDRLVDDLLDLDRLDRGQLQPDRESTDVGAIARRIARESSSLDGHPVRIDADSVLVAVDAVKVERIIENLLLNAAKHTPPATPVRVRVTARADGIELAVEDEGPGIPDDLRVVVFDPFRQGPDAGGKGVGIGLSLVKRFAELHGGSAHVEDRVGGGARFVVWLPGTVSGEPPPAQEGQLRAV
ncbi:MAG: two-component system, OmpR family, sensor histidine kinase KdpD [Actinomycetota bacterium]|jgi:signal transduction histidine kinase|nr:two-component system, OmpR family, sensor histidine kinase KdpD [Actinomycetota bacterium]